jgi:predicted glycogen debranching enzyme
VERGRVPSFDAQGEWLEADGLGGFASGTVSGVRSRRYHALLLHARTPPTGRIVLVNGFDAWLETAAGATAISAQAYHPDVVHPDGHTRIARFSREPWPAWTFSVGDGHELRQEVLAVGGSAVVAVSFRCAGARPPAVLWLRPFFSGRDYHALHHENAAFRFEPERAVREAGGETLRWRTYPDVPAFSLRTNAEFRAEPLWYRSFRYELERERGLDCAEDLASPGLLRFDLAAGEGVLLLAAEGYEGELKSDAEPPAAALERLRARERERRGAFASPLHRAADAYVVRRGGGRTLVAGYPWFTDWGRDTFIALRGLCLGTGRLDVAREILLEWAGAVRGGMLPNRFPDQGSEPEWNAVDASLWYAVAAHELALAARVRGGLAPGDARRLEAAVDAILEGHLAGTRHGIRADADGLLAAGEPGVQLTWMDAKVGDRVVTPRIGKPVEVQALWWNALRIGGLRHERWRALAERAASAFAARFWNQATGALHDVVDVDHRPGTFDASFRPNQIFAVGGLPFALLEGPRARSVVDAVERRLWTPLGLRSLAPGEPGYAARYAGGVRERDGAYHQGTAWPWLLGPFVEAWVRVRGGAPEAKREARERFVAPLLAHLETAGLGHVSEIADAEPPHAPRGCPFQAWSLGELLRLQEQVLR